MLPIVYGAGIATYERMAPPHSFIHVNQFENIKALADYLHYLDRNDTAYATYFAWKAHGRIVVSEMTICCRHSR